MNKKFQSIGIFGKHSYTNIKKTLESIVDMLNKWQISYLMESETATDLNIETSKTGSLEQIINTCDLALIVGGDGSFLKYARHLSLYDIPVIGVNKGNLGFLTDINPNEIEDTLHEIVEGHYLIEERFLIQAEVINNGKSKYKSNALNDIVLFPGELAHMIEFEVHINNQFVYSQRSDGIITATPTGSTAYALSAGGPIVQTNLNVLLLVPMFPHTLTNRPITISADDEIVITLSNHNKKPPRLSYDGKSQITLETNDCIHIKKQPQKLKLLHPKNYNYYETLRRKLSWGTQITKT